MSRLGRTTLSPRPRRKGPDSAPTQKTVASRKALRVMKKHALLLLRLAGLGFLLISAWIPWFEVPGADEAGLTKVHPWATPYFQAGALLVTLLVAGSWLLRWRHPRLALSILPVWGVCLLFFPYTVMVWDPSVAAQSTWLCGQHENLVWLGGDVPTAQEFSKQGEKNRVYVVDSPAELTVCGIGHLSPVKEGFGVIPRILFWLGYDNPFCEFARAGWMMAVLGAMLAVGGLWAVHEPGSRRKAILSGLYASGGVFSVLFTIAMLPFVVGYGRLDEATRATWAGDYSGALRWLESAGRILPVLRENTAYVEQSGLLHYRLGQLDTPEARLHKAGQLEGQSRDQEAEALYLSLLEDAAASGAVRRECLRGLLRKGISSLNSGKTDRAVQLVAFVLAKSPTDLKANYALQLAYLRSGRFRELEALTQRMKWVYGFFHVPTTRPVLATGYENMQLAEFRSGDARAAFENWRQSRRP